MEKVFLFIYDDFYLGGIQKLLIAIIRELKKNNNRIIWIAKNIDNVDEGFKKDIFDGKIDILKVNYEEFFWEKNLKLNISDKEEVIAFSFSFFEFCTLERIKKYNRNIKIHNFFWVAHFCGKHLFFEEYFPKIFQPILKKIIRKEYIKMENNNNIFYNNMDHLRALSNHYSYKVKNYENKIYPKNIVLIQGNFSIENCRKKYNNKNFNILTVGRFEIPHKGYILGLIKEFVIMKKEYPNLILTIIGYGEDENLVLKEIENVPQEIKEDIKLIGKVSYDNLKNYFDNANLFIGVAGAIRDASSNGVLSIPVQHYTLECNGYGYSFKKKDHLTSTEKGENIKTYIDKVIKLSEDEYIDLCKKTYFGYNLQDSQTIGEITLRMKNKTNSLQVDKSLLFVLKLLTVFLKKLKKRGIKLWKE